MTRPPLTELQISAAGSSSFAPLAGISRLKPTRSGSGPPRRGPRGGAPVTGGRITLFGMSPSNSCLSAVMFRSAANVHRFRMHRPRTGKPEDEPGPNRIAAPPRERRPTSGSTRARSGVEADLNPGVLTATPSLQICPALPFFELGPIASYTNQTAPWDRTPRASTRPLRAER